MTPQRTYRTEILPLVEAERLDLADFLETLDEHDWSVPSLCSGWTVHDVAAHLTLSTRQSSLGTFVRVARARGSSPSASHPDSHMVTCGCFRRPHDRQK